MKVIIQTPTPNLKVSIEFYQKLNFKMISDEPFLMSDGKAIIEINKENTARVGVKLYQADWSKEVEELSSLTKVIEIENGYLFSDTSGVCIHLLNEKVLPNIDISNVEASTLGNYMGVSIETIDMAKSIQILEIIGFKTVMGGLELDWIVLMNGGFGISFMRGLSCPHLFFNPSLTYFNGKNNLGIIEKIRQANIPIVEEITVFNKEGIVDNVILRDMGGLGFFVFSD